MTDDTPDAGAWMVVMLFQLVALLVLGHVDLEQRRLTPGSAPPPDSVAVALSPDGRFVAVAGLEETTFVHDVDEGSVVARLDGFAYTYEFAPDGAWLVAIGPQDLRVLSTRDGREHGAWPISPGRPDAKPYAFSTDGRWLAVGASPRIWVVRLAEDPELGPHQPPTEPDTELEPLGFDLRGRLALARWGFDRPVDLVWFDPDRGTMETVAWPTEMHWAPSPRLVAGRWWISVDPRTHQTQIHDAEGRHARHLTAWRPTAAHGRWLTNGLDRIDPTTGKTESVANVPAGPAMDALDRASIYQTAISADGARHAAYVKDLACAIVVTLGRGDPQVRYVRGATIATSPDAFDPAMPTALLVVWAAGWLALWFGAPILARRRFGRPAPSLGVRDATRTLVNASLAVHAAMGAVLVWELPVRLNYAMTYDLGSLGTALFIPPLAFGGLAIAVALRHRSRIRFHPLGLAVALGQMAWFAALAYRLLRLVSTHPALEPQMRWWGWLSGWW